MSRRSDKPPGHPQSSRRHRIGSRFHMVGVPQVPCAKAVQPFKAFTGDIERMADWFVSIGIKTVAMKSTVVYWMSVFNRRKVAA